MACGACQGWFSRSRSKAARRSAARGSSRSSFSRASTTGTWLPRREPNASAASEGPVPAYSKSAQAPQRQAARAPQAVEPARVAEIAEKLLMSVSEGKGSCGFSVTGIATLVKPRADVDLPLGKFPSRVGSSEMAERDFAGG